MRFNEFIVKTIYNNRSYTLGSRYKTEYIDNIFILYHYNTQILKIDTKKKKIMDFYSCSLSDLDAINSSLTVLNDIGCVDYGYLCDGILISYYKRFRVEYFKIDKFKETYNQLTVHQKSILDGLINKIPRYYTLKYSNLLLDEGFDTCTKEIIKEVEKIKKRQKIIDRYEKTYETLKTKNILKVKNGIIILLRGMEDTYQNNVYLVDFKNKQIYANRFYNVQIGRIFYNKKLNSYDKKKLTPVEINKISQFQTSILEIIKKENKDFHKYLVVKSANENI